MAEDSSSPSVAPAAAQGLASSQTAAHTGNVGATRRRAANVARARSVVNRHADDPAPPEDRVIFACLTQHFGTANATRLIERLAGRTVDWEKVGTIAIEHGIGPLLYVNLRRCADAGLPVPVELLQRLRLAYFQSLAEHKRRGAQLQRALEHIRAAGEEAMLLKGAALDATVYEHPEYALSLDIDILVRRTRQDLGRERAQNLWNLNSSGPFEVAMGKHHDLDLGGLFPVNYPSLWEHARAVEVHGVATCVMGPADMLVFACVNSGRKRFFHPRNLFALRTLVEDQGPIDWNEVTRSAERHRCGAFVYTALQCAARWLAVKIPADLRTRLRVSRARAALIRWLVENMSFASLEMRTTLLQNRSPKAGIRERRKWQTSALLPFACYSGAQLWHRIRWLTED
jgi:hypothetical protein